MAETQQTALKCRLPGYKATFFVNGFQRRRNAGPVLTLANATYCRDGCETVRTSTNVVTMMKLADLLSDHHGLPVNQDKLYGPLGRGCDIGRTN